MNSDGKQSTTTQARGRILTVCVSMPKLVEANGRKVLTGIFKEPVEERLQLRKLNLDGDAQADLTVHGGPDKALYTYASEHYSWWRNKMPDVEFTHGKFGENLTTEGLLEHDVCIGDEYQIGTAIVKVAQPRMPCYKLGIRFGRADIIKTFMQSTYSGIYFSVVREGNLAVGDEIKYLRSDEHGINLQEVARQFVTEDVDRALIRRALKSQLAEQMKMFLSSLL